MDADSTFMIITYDDVVDTLKIRTGKDSISKGRPKLLDKRIKLMADDISASGRFWCQGEELLG